MSDTDMPIRLTFTLSEAEYWKLRTLEARHFDRGPSMNSFLFVILLYAFGVGFALLAAYYAGLVAKDELRAVLATGYIASALAVILLYWLLHLRSRKMVREAFRAAGADAGDWQVEIDDAGITAISRLLERRARWSAITAIEDYGPSLAIWLERLYVLSIPTRVFAHDAARAAFIAAVQARIDQARETKRKKGQQSAE